MTATNPQIPIRPRRRFRRVYQLLILALIVADILAMVVVYPNYRDRRLLDAAIAETDRLDPGWRLEDLLARRQAIPDDQNGAAIVRAVCKLQDGKSDWGVPDEGYQDEELWSLKPNETMPPAKAKILRDAMAERGQALIEVRKLIDRPRGRFAVDWTGNPMLINLPAGDVRATNNLLMYEARLHIENGKLAEAFACFRGMINQASYLDEEPALISFLVMIACDSIAIQMAERALGHGEVAEPVLADFQRRLEQELSKPRFVLAMRGERAISERFWQMVDDGLLAESPSSVAQMLANSGAPKSAWQWLDELREKFFPKQRVGSIPAVRASMLRYYQRMIEAAKSEEKQKERMAQIEAEMAADSPAVKLLSPAVAKVAVSNHMYQARLLTAITAIAAERFRLRHGRWPESLEQLTPEFLPQVPRDPFVPKSLIYQRLSDGIAIYSVGQDETDDGGDLESNHPGTPGKDIGFRLWNPEKRHQPPANKKAEDNRQ